jgi:hypothetical protein
LERLGKYFLKLKNIIYEYSEAKARYLPTLL